MRTVNMHEAKIHLSRLVEQASKGKPFVIARAGKPLVKVVPIEAEAEPKVEAEPAKPKLPRLGFMRGQFSVPADFDTMFADEIREMFEGDENDSVRRLLEGRE